MNPQHNQTTTQNLIPNFGNQEQSMTSLEIAELCSKQHAHVCRDIEKLNTIYKELGLSKIGEGSYTHKNTGSQQHRMFLLNKAQSLDLVTGYKPELRILVNRRWQELEDQLKQNEIILPDFTNPADAAIAWAEQYKAKQQACIDRDHAIATKALIGKKREATAMATASKYKRENDKLKNKIAESLNFASIKKVQIHSKEKFSPYPLRKYSKEHGLEIQKVDDVNYDKVNAYHKDAWLAVYDIDISAFEMKS